MLFATIISLATIRVQADPPNAAVAGPLRPDDLLLIYNADDPRSRELATYYAQVRSVPGDRLCPVRARGDQEEIPRQEFDRFIRQPVRSFLQEHDLTAKVRCVVTFCGLPIRVGPKLASETETRLAEQWRREFGASLQEMKQLTADLEQLGRTAPGAAESSASGSRPSPTTTRGEPATQTEPDEEELADLAKAYQQALTAAWARIGPQVQQGKAQAEYRRMIGAMEQAEGLIALVQRMRPQNQAVAPDVQQQLDQMAKAATAIETQITQQRSRGLADPGRNESRSLVRKNHGLLGMLRSLTYDISLTRTEESQASLDSELGLLWWDEYPLYRWVPNTLSWKVRTNAEWQAALPSGYRQPVLMTSRIDGPSMQVARRLIDDAIATEKRGLAGTVYLDSRGLPAGAGFGEYDQSLRDLAAILWKHTHLTVRLDSQPEVFAPASCPEAMLYCGWYSLRRFVNSCEFVPGAVGYHIASFEAISLKRPGETGWCKGLLDAGVAATIGPVAEPYLQSFPHPHEFFPLLLTGRFTLAQCYAYTTAWNSWMMMLIGDPLYRPFGGRPVLELEAAFTPEQIPPEFRKEAMSSSASHPAGATGR